MGVIYDLARMAMNMNREEPYPGSSDSDFIRWNTERPKDKKREKETRPSKEKKEIA